MRKVNLIIIGLISLIMVSCGSNETTNTKKNETRDTLAIVAKIDKKAKTIQALSATLIPKIVYTGEKFEGEENHNDYYYDKTGKVIRVEYAEYSGATNYYISNNKLIQILVETEAGTELYYFDNEKLFCQMNDYVGDGTMKPLVADKESETNLLKAFNSLNISATNNIDEDEADGELLDETLLLTEEQLMPKGSYDVNDFDFERFGKFDDKKILSQLWTKEHDKYLKKANVSVYLYPNRLSDLEEVVLFVSLNKTPEGEDSDPIYGEDISLWYVVYDNKKVIDYACLSQQKSEYRRENESVKIGKFTSKTEFSGKWKSKETGATEDFSLTLLNDGHIAEEIEGVDAEEYEDESEEISLYPETIGKFEVAGIDNDKQVYEFIQNLKHCGSRDELMQHIDFPFMMNGKGTEKSQFPKDCDKILTYLAMINFDENSASSRGVMVGSGEIYINSVDNKLKITTINIE